MIVGGTLPGRTEPIVHLSPLYIDHGPIITSAGFKKEHIDATMAYTPLEDDLHLATYPKSGTTWVEQILRLIFTRGVKTGTTMDSTNSIFIEMLGVDLVTNMKRPCVIKTHFPATLWKDPKKGKYIFVVRNPKDVAVSFFHHQRHAFPDGYVYEEGGFKEFFELFLNGPMEYNDYFDHLLSWYQYTKNDNVLIVHYEELKDDPSGQILRMAKFMGDQWYKMLTEEEGILDKVLELSSFGSMKKAYESMEIPLSLFTHIKTDSTDDNPAKTRKVKDFVRSGKVGGWREMFTDEMNRRMNERIIERLMSVCPEIVEMWRQHGIMD